MVPSRLRHVRSTLLAAGAALALALGAVAGLPASSQAAAGALPCDIYGSAGTPCVSADSTTRALYSAYNGPLYQVQRQSDGAKTDVGVLSAGGYANAATQDAFCASTTCIITEVYDQSPQHNNLPIEGPGGEVPHADQGANATALPVTAGGHKVYGIYVAPGVGYRDNGATGTARNGQPEGAYMVASGQHVNSDCCFDYGNVESNSDDNGASHMDALNLTTHCDAPCNGPGPWVEIDMENGQFMGGNGSNTNNQSVPFPFVTAVMKNDGQNLYAIKAGNAVSGGLNTWYSGPLPSGYSPMHQEGAIVLGTGGDNSNAGVGSFFEGVMTAGYPTDAADNAVQANITSVGYSTSLAGAGTNLLTNGGFEANGATTHPTGWSTTNDAADYTETQGEDGTYRLTHWSPNPYTVYTYQVATGLPNGTYQLTAQAESGGGQNQLFLQARYYDAAGSIQQANISAGAWRQVTIPAINVTNGQVMVGVYSDGNAGNWASFDDITLVKVGPPTLPVGSRVSLAGAYSGASLEVSGGLGVTAQINSTSAVSDRTAATFVVHAGLANPSCYSFESAATPGTYLRHASFRIHDDANDGSTLFDDDSTFCADPGNAGKGTSFYSANYPDHFLRAYNGQVWIASDGGGNPSDAATTWPQDSSWNVVAPWAP